LVTYINFAPLKKRQKRCEREQKRTKFDEKGARTDQKAARFALPIFTQKAQIALHGPETRIRAKKNAYLPVSASGKLT